MIFEKKTFVSKILTVLVMFNYFACVSKKVVNFSETQKHSRKMKGRKIEKGVKVKADKLKSRNFCNEFSAERTDFVAKTIKKERLSQLNVPNYQNVSATTSNFDQKDESNSNNDDNNNSNLNNDSIISSTSDFDSVRNHANVPSFDDSLSGFNGDDLIPPESKLVLQKNCDTSIELNEVLIHSAGSSSQNDDVTLPVKTDIFDAKFDIISRFFIVNDMISDEKNIAANCNVCNNKTLVRGAKKASSNFIRHIAVSNVF